MFVLGNDLALPLLRGWFRGPSRANDLKAKGPLKRRRRGIMLNERRALVFYIVYVGVLLLFFLSLVK
jgi:hypothetical protein